MALIVRIAVLLGTLGLCRSQVDAFKSSTTQRKDAKFGRPVLAMANSPRCMFNGRPVEDGRSVSSPEPCLNCTCSKGILLCYLRTCSTVVSSPGCQVVRKKGECCPKLECKGATEYRTERTSEPSYKYRLRQDEGTFFGLIGLDPRTERSNTVTTITTTRKPAPKLNYRDEDWASSKNKKPSPEFHTPEEPPIEQEEDYGSDDLAPDTNDTAAYCYHKGYKYTDGMAMLSPTKCEYCYCIRGQQMCVRPKCHLNIDKCVARYQSGYTCCPSHYQCEVGAQGIDADEYQLTPSAAKPQEQISKVTSCNVEGYDFDVGVAVPSSGNCQTCYCTQVGVVCRRLECSPSVPGCTPIVPEGHCCPTEYKCDQQGVNETKVPVSHSTENYDVTVISPSETEGVSSDFFETESTDEGNYEEVDDHTTISDYQDDESDTAPDKQKITVELTDDSDLESISVIPEENIAVLVVTTEKNSDRFAPSDDALLMSDAKIEPDTIYPSYLKQKIKSSTTKTDTTITDGTQYSQHTTKPTIISLTNLKHKTKPSTTRGPTTTMYGTRYSQDSTRPSIISLPNLKHKTKPSTTRGPTTVTYGAQYFQYTTRQSAIPLTNLKQKTKTSTTKDVSTLTDETLSIQDTTKPTLISLPNLKQKTKTSTTKMLATTLDDMTYESTPYIHSTHDIDSSTEKTKYSTHKNSNYNGENKDNYAYDYVELYEDVPRDEPETFAPFAEYGESTYGERLTTKKEQETTLNNRFKIKSKKPPSLSQTRDPTTQSVTPLANSKFATDGLTTQRVTNTETDHHHATHSTISLTETDKSTDYPTRYTIYSTTSEKTQRPYSIESTGRIKQKTKLNRPLLLTNTQYVPSTTQDTRPLHSTISQTSTRISQSGEYETTPDQTFDDRYVTEINRPSSHSVKHHYLINSNHKQKPQRLTNTETTLPYKSTKPLPQEIADLLWSITQKHNAQPQDESTESYGPTTGKETHEIKTSETSEYSPDTLIVAAPKLIVEDTTSEGNYGTLQFETTNSDTPTFGSVPPSIGSPLPGLIFKVPEIIFSNHGPASHRKQPSTVREPEPPLEINNHKKTSRPRPPIRFRPPSTPSVPQTSFMEISNHRPTNTFRRPPGKFPPYPNYNNQRAETGFRRQNPRDPHHSLHRIAPDIHPEWREDYDEYYYDFEQNRSPTTRVFTNMQEHQTTAGMTDSGNQTPEANSQSTAEKNYLSINHTTVTNPEYQDEIKSTISQFSGETITTTNQDNISGRSSEDKTSKAIDTTIQATISTTPYPTTNQVTSTSTKSFLKDPVPEDEVKLFRAEDNNKDIEGSFIDKRHDQYEGKQNKFEVIDGRPSAERPVLKPMTSIPEESPMQPIDLPKSEEDSKEINDVCFVDGRYYNSGEIIVKSNPCEMCRCFYGHPLCQVQTCPSPPEPSCVLEYLPGYCCPRVTCGIKMDSSQSSSDVSAPDPTNQEIRPPLITSDNQWKPLPHGPIVRPVENIPKVETPVPEVFPVTLPPQAIVVEEKSKEDSDQRTEPNAEKNHAFSDLVELDASVSVTTTPAATTSTSPSITTTTSTQATSTTTKRVEITTYFPEITTEPPTEPTTVFEPVSEDDPKQNKSDIHDNSSGVRKILGETVTLPPSKMSLSLTGGENISTVLPVIQTLPPTPSVTELPGLEFDTVANFVIGDLPAELGGNLKVSGCNVYGKYYRINDKVTALSKPCSECVCSPDGIACNATC